jgi:site-specific DNA-methyltransferase (adenine-specific)
MDRFLNQIICGDCLDVMRELPDKSVDLVVTDPPYGINVANNMHKQAGTRYGKAAAAKSFYLAGDWDKSIPTKEYFREIQRVSKNQIIFGGNYFVEHLHNSPCWIVWDKDNGDNNFADCELAWTSFKTAVRKIKYRWNGMLQENMKEKEYRFHPTQKPIGVFEWILDNYSDPNSIILDPFLGSGTTAIAAHNTGRFFIGIEKEPKYVEIARKRLEQAQAQQSLFA